MNTLNPSLYQALQARLGEVKIMKEDEENTHTTSPNWHRGGKLQRHVDSSGQYFAVCCPFCNDTRFRLWINYEWGVRDPLSGNDNLHLAICYNEHCLRTRARQLQLKRMLDPFDEEISLAPRPGVAVPQDTWAAAPSMPCLPPGSVPIIELPLEHPAITYLASRHFDVLELWDRWRVQYCERSPLTSPPITQRLVIPIYQPADTVVAEPRLVGWAARSLMPSPTAPKYLFNAGLRASHVLYGLPAAQHTAGPVVVVEGPTDAWRVGPGAVALLGKSLSITNRGKLLSLARERPIVVMLDRDAGTEARAIRDTLRGCRAQEAGEKRVVVVQVPGGAKDPGDCTRKSVWEAAHLALKPAQASAPSESILATVPAGVAPIDWTIEAAGPSMLDIARDYLARGIWVLPQEPGKKQPCITWKEYQDRPPTDAELVAWFGYEWPNAGMVAILGRGPRLFAVDVDGPEAHAALVARLGSEPMAPKVLSGSGKPHRYHLFFRHPSMPTKAKVTPWHEQVEFRGDGGIVVLPPSEHRSGNRYAWAPGRSLDDMSLPEVPAAILEALAAEAVTIRRKACSK